jgi:putative hydrolase of the HAD superfamily
VTAHKGIEALLFDLGGVAIDIDFTRVFAHWSQFSPYAIEEIAERCVFDDIYHRYERAQIDDATFFDHVRHRLALDADEETIRSGWNAVFVGQNDAVLAMIAAASQRLPVYAFTNTSASHQLAWSTRYPAVVQAFRRIFSSAEIGLRKPDIEAFTYVVDRIGNAAGSVLFFDDMGSNVAGARAAGLQAVQVLGDDDVRGALERIGAL